MMKGKRLMCLILASLLMLGMLPAVSAAETATIYDLRVNDLESPMGLDDAEPVFSWKMNSDTVGAAQSAYRIVVSARQDLSSPVWDSGKVTSDLSAAICYEGEPLAAETAYYWQVHVWDQEGKESLSEISSFETGLMDASLWGEEIKWISVTEEPTVHYTVEADITPQPSTDPRHGAALVFGAKDTSSFYMAHFRINGDFVEYRPHIYGTKSGASAPSWSTTAHADLTEKLGWSTTDFVGRTFHLKLDVTDQRISTYVDGILVSSFVPVDYLPVDSIGKLGTRGQHYEKHTVDNIVIKNVLNDNETVCSYDFEDGVNPFGVGAVADGVFKADFATDGTVGVEQKTHSPLHYTVEADVRGDSGDVNLIYGAIDKSHFYMAHFNISGNTLQYKPHTQTGSWSSKTIDLTANYGITVSQYQKEGVHFKADVTPDKIISYVNGTKVHEWAPHASIPVTFIGQLGVRWYNGTGYLDNIKVTDYTNSSAGIVGCYYDFEDGNNPFGVGTVRDGVYIPGGTKSAVVLDPNTYSFKNKREGSASFRKEIAVKENILSARLYSTALGTYDAFINGERVGRLLPDGSTQYDELKPSFTDAKARKLYYTYDVTHLLKAGQLNTLAAWVTDGYWSGDIVLSSRQGTENAFAARLVIEYADGTKDTVSTDTDWFGAYAGPMMYGDIYHGETYDARASLNWMQAGHTGWLPVHENHEFDGVVAAHSGTSTIVRKDLELSPKEMYVYSTVEGASSTNNGRIVVDRTYSDGELITLNKGETLVVDVGQNHAGWESFVVSGKKGTRIRVRHGEVLNIREGTIGAALDGPKGSVFVTNMRTAKTTTLYTLSGNGKESYHPTMTYYGYRYLEFTASDTVTFDLIRSQVLTNVHRDSGNVVTSNEKLNQLIRNARWGQYSNFVGVPTDCPQRDERAGWLADTWVFANTAEYYSADTKAFLQKWMNDVVDCQTADGRYQSGSPGGGGYGTPLGRTGWADAALIVPYNMYLMTGDFSLIEENYASMQRYVDGYLATTNKKGADGWYGDWLAPGDNNDDTVKELLGVVFYAWDALMMADMAELLGKSEDAVRYKALYETEKQFFIDTYVNEDGTLISKRQTPALYALYLDLLPNEASREAVKAELLDHFKNNNNKIATGFMGTAIVMQVLSELGQEELAYEILLQEHNPSWLYAVNNGATTIWEKWDACAEDGAFKSGSLNHYAYGCVVEWMYRYMAGIDYDENVPGFKRIVLAPLPNQMVGSVSATHDSPYGKILSAWKYEGERFTYNATLPANTTAQIRLPVEEISTLTVNGKNYNAVTAVTDGIEFVSLENGVAVFEAVAGTFSFAAAVTEENYIKIETTGNGGVPVNVKVNGEPVGNAPIKAAPGETLCLSAACANFVDYRVVQWSENGEIIGDSPELKYTVNGNATLIVSFEKLETENVAQGAAVTANQVNTTWDKSHITDGKLCHLEGTNGWSSNGQGKNIEFTAPVEAVMDLGSVKTVSQLRLYPRTDADAGSEPFNFPVDYVISVSTDNASWTPVVTVTDGAAVCWKPAVHFLDTAVQAQYIKLSVTAVNRPDGSGNAYVQLSEFTAHNSACNHISGEPIVDVPATPTTDGSAHTECLICSKRLEEIVLPAGKEAMIGDTAYATLCEALSAAGNGDHVIVLADVAIDRAVIHTGITLDLNGYAVSAEYVIGFKGSAVIDSSAAGSGKLIVDKNKTALDRDNGGYLPVYSENGYIFVTVNLTDRTALLSQKQFAFSPVFETVAHEPLMAGYENSGVKIVIRLSWEEAGNYRAIQDFLYLDEMVRTVIGSYDITIPNYKRAFSAAFEGSEAGNAENVSVSAVIISDTGVEIASAPTGFTA